MFTALMKNGSTLSFVVAITVTLAFPIIATSAAAPIAENTQKSWPLYGDGQEQTGLIIPLDTTTYVQYLDQLKSCTKPDDRNILGTCKDLFLDFTGTWGLDAPLGNPEQDVTEIALVLWQLNQTFEVKNQTLSIIWDGSEEVVSSIREVPVLADSSTRTLVGYSYTENVCEIAYGVAERRRAREEPALVRYHCKVSAVLDSLVPDLSREALLAPIQRSSISPAKVSVALFGLGFHLIQPAGKTFNVQAVPQMQTSRTRYMASIMRHGQTITQLFWTMASRKYQYTSSNSTAFSSLSIENATLRDAHLGDYPDVRLVLSYPTPVVSPTETAPTTEYFMGFKLSDVSKLTGTTVVLFALILFLIGLAVRKVVLAIKRRRQLRQDRDRVAAELLSDDGENVFDDHSVDTGLFDSRKQQHWLGKLGTSCRCGPCSQRTVRIYSATGNINANRERRGGGVTPDAFDIDKVVVQ